MREFKPTKSATLDSIAEDIAKLCRHVDSLEKSVARLFGRIKPFDDEKDPRPRFDDYGWDQSPKPTLEAILTRVILADKHLKGAELDVGAIRSHLDQISNDSWSRAELRESLDDKKKR